MSPYQCEHVIGVGSVTCVDDHVEADAAESGVRAEAMDSDVKDVDVLRGEDTGQLMKQARLVVEPGAEREITTR